MKGFIAVDGGGSKTEVVLVNVLGNILSHKIVNCTNPNDVGMEESFNTLNDVLGKMILISRENNIELDNISLLIAGIEFGDSKMILRERLKNSLSFENIYVDGDLASVKEVGLSKKSEGIVIIAGTGFNMAIKKDNKFENIGGWGYLADNFISGFDLGKDALIFASRAINGIGKKTLLVDYLENKYSNSLWYSMKQIYDGGIKEVASLSRIVVDAYKENDDVAREIIDTRIEYLVEIIKNKTNEISELDVVLFGGIFENNSFIVDKLKEKLSSKYHIIVSNSKTIYGAISIGYKLTGLSDKEFYFNFDNNYRRL